MPVEKVIFRLAPQNISRANEATFQTLYEARVDRPLDDLDLNEVFQNVNSLLQVGDAVNFCAYEGSMTAADRKLRQVRQCRITSKGVEALGGTLKIRAAWVGDAIEIPTDALPKTVKEDNRKLEIKKEFGGGFTIRDDKGHVIEQVKTKAEAEAYVANLGPKVEKPKPQEAKPAAA